MRTKSPRYKWPSNNRRGCDNQRLQNKMSRFVRRGINVGGAIAGAAQSAGDGVQGAAQSAGSGAQGAAGTVASGATGAAETVADAATTAAAAAASMSQSGLSGADVSLGRARQHRPRLIGSGNYGYAWRHRFDIQRHTEGTSLPDSGKKS